MKLRMFLTLLLFWVSISGLSLASDEQVDETSAGFLAGTVVLTRHGAIPIEQVKPGYEVLSCSENKVCEYKTVLNVGIRPGDSYVVVTVLGVDMGVSPDQLFYEPKKDRWIDAKDLKKGDHLLDLDGDQVEVTAIETVERGGIFYDLSIEGNHTYYVSHARVLCHNFAVVIPFVYVIGEGIAWTAMAKIAAYGTVALALGCTAWKVGEAIAHANSVNREKYGVGQTIDLDRFSDRQSRSGQKGILRDPKTGEYLERDRGNNPHGGSYWKLKDRKGRKIVTITKEGKVLRD